LTDKLSIAANLNFNQVLHNHALDNEYDTDQNWFTTGAKLNYNFTENLSGSFGYSTNLDSSNFDSKIWTFGLCYGF
jgi:long-subunit fatty acid transport protein